MNHRICILGNSGSGKSLLANRLGQDLNLPVYHLDKEMLYGNFEKHPIEKRQVIHSELIKGDSWIIDGNYHKFLPERLDRATAVIFLNISRLTTLKRIFDRAKAQSHPENSIPEQADKTKLSWEFIRWVLKYSRRKRLKAITELLAQTSNAKMIILGSGTVEEWVLTVKQKLSH